MEGNMIVPAEISSIAHLNKKRKFQAELLEMPFPKHVSWDQRLEYDSSSDSSTDPKKARIGIYSGGRESDPESAKDSYSLHGDADSVLSPHESRSMTKSSSSKSEPVEELDCLHQDYGLYTSDNHEDELLEFGGVEHCTDEDLDNLLYANGVVPSNYILSSGRWSVNQDTQQGTKKLTIDKEFEQYFSMLML